MAKSSPEVLVKLSRNPKKRIKMLINDIITEEIRLNELFGKGAVLDKNNNGVYKNQKYTFNKEMGNWYLPGTQELLAPNSELYRVLAKSWFKQNKRPNKQQKPGSGRLAPDTYKDKLTPGKVLKKTAAAIGRYGIDKPSDAVAGVLKKGFNAVSKAFGRDLPSQQNQKFNKGDKVSFISNHATSKGKQVMATVMSQNANNPDHYQVKSDTNPNPFLIPADRLTKIQA
jgi:hypothetical protein